MVCPCCETEIKYGICVNCGFTPKGEATEDYYEFEKEVCED